MVSGRRQAPWWVNLLACLCIPVVFPILYPTVKAIQGTIVLTRKGREAKQRYDWSQHRKKVRNTRLPRDSPPVSLTGNGAAQPLKGRVTFLDLPLEIRQDIYELALGGPWIFQPSYGWSLRGPRPQHWPPWQHVRGDAEPNSKALSQIVALGGSGLKPDVRPRQSGCVVHHHHHHHDAGRPELVCGDVYAYEPGVDLHWKKRMSHHLELMLVCRRVYADMLDFLYSDCTISLFGIDMVYYFTQNASPDGLRRVRFVHVALVVSANRWESKKKKEKVRGAVRCVKEAFVNMLALDVELVITWGQPSHPERFCHWLRGGDVLGQLRGLENLVVKIAVYNPLTKGMEQRYRWTPPCERLQGWDEKEYLALKNAVTTSPAAATQ